MDAVEYVKTQFRLCRSKDSCSECPLQDKENCCCIMDTIEYAEKSVRIVEQWAKDHPVKTRQSEFLKQFPSAFTSESVLQIQPCLIDKDIKLKYHTCFFYNCDDCKRKFWLTPIDESEEK